VSKTPAVSEGARLVWFGEMPLHLDAIEAALAAADLFVAVGTSGSVYPPAAGSAGRTGRVRAEIRFPRSAGTAGQAARPQEFAVHVHDRTCAGPA
jgi:hypothetical protein